MKARHASFQQQTIVNLVFALVCPIGAILFSLSLDQLQLSGQPIVARGSLPFARSGLVVAHAVAGRFDCFCHRKIVGALARLAAGRAIDLSRTATALLAIDFLAGISQILVKS